MELLDIDTIQVLLKYGSFALTFGIVIIISFELFIFGVVKAISFCLLYTSDAADELDGVVIGGGRVS